MKLWHLIFRSTFDCPECDGTLEYGPGASIKEYFADAYLVLADQFVWVALGTLIGGLTFWFFGEIVGLAVSTAIWLAITRYFAKFQCRKCGAVFTCSELLQLSKERNSNEKPV
jgi:predicted RNA-binding Zn-ribbon protein involved in translation (DUF1610 family)